MFRKEEYCNLDLCQLLVDNGYSEPTEEVICKEDFETDCIYGIRGKSYIMDADFVNKYKGFINDKFLNHPTLHEARKWVERTFNWRIEVMICIGGSYTYALYNMSDKESLKQDINLDEDLLLFWDSEEKALDVALRHVLRLGEASPYKRSFSPNWLRES